MGGTQRSRVAYFDTQRRVNSGRTEEERYYRQTYEDGNAVRKLEEIPEEAPRRKQRPARKVSERAQRNRNRARSMSAGYVVFLSVVCVLTLFLCIHYLQLRARLTNQSETIASMESTLSRLQADNDAYEKQVQSIIDLEDVRETALNKLDMHVAMEDQIIYYQTSDDSYVRQYMSVPAG